MIFQFLIVQILLALSNAFTKAPGRLTLKVGLPEMIESCLGQKCLYKLDICIGSGKSGEEQCMWDPSKRYEGLYIENQDHLAEISFEVDDVRASFYVNANWTILTESDVVTTMKFKDCFIKYDVVNGTKRESHYSESFVSMSSEINVTCRSGFYPKYQCTRSCFEVTGIYACDSNGRMTCVQEYVWDVSTGKCVKDACKSNTSLCQNNSTCVNEKTAVSCVCQTNYFGRTCENWDPCKDHKCENSGLCVKNTVERDYHCLCPKKYQGRYCHSDVDPCIQRRCPQGSVCQVKLGAASCIESAELSKTIVNNVGWFRRKSSAAPRSMLDKVNLVGEDDLKPKETVKLLQYPIQKDFTTIVIIVALLVFMVFCFGVTFWMQRYAYSQKKKKYNSYPNIAPIPSLINTPTYRSADDNFKRWHSLDDNSFYICHQPHNEHFATMSYKSGSNIWPRYDNNQDVYRDCYRNWPQTLKTKMPMMSESNHLESDNTTGNFCETSQNNSEKMEDFVPGTLFLDNMDLNI